MPSSAAVLLSCFISSAFVCSDGLETHFSNWDPIDDELEWEESFGAETVYRILKPSTLQHAPHLEYGDNATVHAIGRLMYSNKVFWQTRAGKPHNFVAGQAEIAGWHIGTIHMLEGERRLIRIPSDEAQNAQLHHAWDVPDDADLELEVELISIEGKDQEFRAAHGLKKVSVAEEIDATVHDNPVVIFCDTSARSMLMKHAVEEALEEREVYAYKSVELSHHADLYHYTNHLETLTGMRGLPLLFLGGKYHGDIEITAESHNDGSLSALLDKVAGKKNAHRKEL